MSIGFLVRGNAPSLGAVVGAVGFAQGSALASQQGAGVVEHIVRPPLIPLYLAALGRFATILGLPSDGLKYLGVESPVSFGPFTW